MEEPSTIVTKAPALTSINLRQKTRISVGTVSFTVVRQVSDVMRVVNAKSEREDLAGVCA